MKSIAQPARNWIKEALEQHQAALTRYAMRMTGDLEKARDVVQDTFLQMCRQEPGHIQDHLVQWLYTVCRNKALDLHRKESRMTAFQDGEPARVPDTSVSPADEVETKERLEAVLGALNTLTPNQQEVIRLKFQDDLSYREISQITGLSVSNVGFQIHTGIKKLRQTITRRESNGSSVIRRVK